MSKKIFILKTKDEATIEVVRFGNSKPNILLISGIHGDEKTGAQVLEQLISEIGSQKIQGTINIIKVANPQAYQANQRLHPNDHKDLNRSFPSPGNNTPADNLASILGEFAISHDLVVDLHTFPNQISPLIGVLLSEGNEERRKESNELLKIINPDLIWFLDVQATEPQKGGSICSLALKKNITAFGLELPPDDLASQDQMKRVVEGLKAVLVKLSVIDHQLPIKAAGKVPVYERQVYKSLDDGQFTPQKSILTRVNKNEIIGKITNQQTGQIKEIISPIDGVLLTVSRARAVKRGEKLFVLGREFYGHFNCML
ncbi:hypothetical protein COT27_00950 [Candidatus Kuenenbacteria bacterium CG08_land_8_20_14_0_20_37_23]|uniref:Succinylglutamate desuccinylase/Aspartoacylase catalytic domain-containing protein n=1 Tax=Candidatus Kuenenbacteria bacterium CG08_land_8_20_14_0_20_37_23 TaxID=1974617 RepID=A0A2M6XT95_9BACT|nr:MAG: hypothetical protein COT27_00950 [Candidatus Kuenenbacteria bacterium CG08_land_8_20_14_0_20_37_23]